MMKMIVSAFACLLVCGSMAVADEKKSEPQQKRSVVDVKVVPRVGVPLPNVRPLPGRHYWQHPTYGWGNWYYPAPVQAAPANYYIDGYGRVVPNGYAYNGNGQLVPLPAVQPPVYQYPYPYYGNPYNYGRWNRWGYWR